MISIENNVERAKHDIEVYVRNNSERLISAARGDE